MMHHAQIAQRAFNTPLMVDPAKALAFLSGLGPAHHRAGNHLPRAGRGRFRSVCSHSSSPGLAVRQRSRPAPSAQRHPALCCGRWHRRDRNRGHTCASRCLDRAILGPDLLRGDRRPAAGGTVADPGVRGIALDIDSFGGEVAGAPSIWRIASAPPGRRSRSTHSSPNMRCRLAMSSPPRPTGSSCPAPALSAASASWRCTPT